MKFIGIYEGDLEIKKGDKNDYSELTEITGYLNIYSDVQLPQLQTIGGYLNIYSDVQLPQLQTIGGYLNIYSDVQLPQLQTIGGSLDIYSDVQLPQLQTIGGYLNIYSDVNVQLPQLQTIGGYLYTYSDVNVELNKNLKQNDPNAKLTALKFTFDCFFKLGFVFADGILAKLIEKKKNVYKIQICGQTKISYCVENINPDGTITFAHGETIKQAKADLIYKFQNKDTSIYENYTLDTVITLKEALQMYHDITGACSLGTKHFVENVLTVKKDKYTIRECIELTKGQYNCEKLQEFFERK